MPKIISEIIPDAVNAATFDATNPNYNIWVSANAGSGKTHVLSQRVIRILLNKIEPHRILCLTYTKAAANEMKIRIFKQLSNWATMDDDALSVEIKNLEHIKPDKEKLENYTMISKYIYVRYIHTYVIINLYFTRVYKIR